MTENKEIPTNENVQRELKVLDLNLDMNLSDFALFLSVMKNQTAHECILSIIMGEPDLKLKKVHVEEVILNNQGKRAIRLDAWALSTDGRQFNTEMQNDTEHDDVRKRSRFYQGLLDTPILKSGKHTKYKELPVTIVTFITQEDIFGKDSAKYVFTEQCKEFPELELGDGTTKIFLNMKSQNGNSALVSLLQYMKHTKMDNPHIKVWDERLKKIAQVVKEVKESEEWEDVKMGVMAVVMERGKELGMEEGMKQGTEYGEVKNLVSIALKKLKRNMSPEEVADLLETDVKIIRQIYEIAKRFAPEYDERKVSLELWRKMKNAK